MNPTPYLLTPPLLTPPLLIPQTMPYRDDDYQGLDPGEYPDPDFEDDESTNTEQCPYCKKQIYSGAERCPLCGVYLTEEEAVGTQKPWWIVVVSIVLLIVIALFWFNWW